MGINIEIHSVDDWEALYIDGVLYRQNHSDQLEGFLLEHFCRDEKGPLTIDTLTHDYHESDAIGIHVIKHGRFPEHLSDFQEIQLEAKREELREKQAGVEAAQAELDALKAEIETLEER